MEQLLLWEKNHVRQLLSEKPRQLAPGTTWGEASVSNDPSWAGRPWPWLWPRPDFREAPGVPLQAHGPPGLASGPGCQSHLEVLGGGD